MFLNYHLHYIIFRNMGMIPIFLLFLLFLSSVAYFSQHGVWLIHALTIKHQEQFFCKNLQHFGIILVLLNIIQCKRLIPQVEQSRWPRGLHYKLNGEPRRGNLKQLVNCLVKIGASYPIFLAIKCKQNALLPNGKEIFLSNVNRKSIYICFYFYTRKHELIFAIFAKKVVSFWDSLI